MEEQRRTAFLSYSWDNSAHEHWVVTLTNRLREEGGVEANCDKFEMYTKTVDMQSMMIDQIRDNDYVIIILTEGYADKVDGKKGGVGFETMLINPLLQENKDKLIFITRGKDRIKSTPFQIKAFYTIDFSDENKFDDKFKELLHRIYEVPLYQKASLGRIPKLTPKEITVEVEEFVEELVVIDNQDVERVLWLLPRGFLIFDDITYDKSSSWSVCAHHYSYAGEWIHSTHYHEGYSDTWNNRLERQLSKLNIPKADSIYGRIALGFLQELRHVQGITDIAKKVRAINEDNLVKYYSATDDIILPSLPEEYINQYMSGEVRDVLIELGDISRFSYGLKSTNIETKDAYAHARSARRRALISVKKYLGEENSNIKFVEEAVFSYNDDVDLMGLGEWAKELAATISDVIE